MEKKKIIIIVIGLIVLFLTVNVCAAVTGNNNIFFAIRNLVETKNVEDKEELLEDSYEINYVGKEENDANVAKETKIEGTYSFTEDLEKISYVFNGEEVRLETLATKIGTYEIEENTVKIKFTKTINPEGIEEKDISEDELIIKDENTLLDEENNVEYIKER